MTDQIEYLKRWEIDGKDVWNSGTGKMKIEPHTFLLPKINIRSEVERRSGDTRTTEMPGLTSIHTVFLREHNNLCDRKEDMKASNSHHRAIKTVTFHKLCRKDTHIITQLLLFFSI